MPELYTDYRTRQPPIDSGSGLAPLPLPRATLVRRRRLLRYGGLLAIALGMAMSTIPGPKGSSHTIKPVMDHGVKVQVHEFFFSRHYGLPFPVARVDYNDNGSIKNLSLKFDNFFGNLGVALVTVIAASIYLGRRRRDD
jgi:hypothetical protein